MPVNTENIRRWIEQSDIDYISYFIKAWIPFNAWYNANYGSCDTDRAKINVIKRDGNLIRNKINNLMENDGPDSLDFRSHLASLHHELLETDIQGRDGRIWFQDILKEQNPKTLINERFNRVDYHLKVSNGTRGVVSKVEVHVKKRNGTQTVFSYEHTEYNINHIQQHSNFNNLSASIQEQVRLYFVQLEPLLVKPIIAEDLSNSMAFYSCEGVNFIRNLENTNCYSISVCKGLIEILYQLRNVLFHGELVPNKDSQRVYKNAYFCLKYLLRSLE